MFFFIILLALVILLMIIGRSSSSNLFLNSLAIVLLIIEFLYLVLILSDFIPRVLKYSFEYLGNMTSSIDVVVLVALITGFLTLLSSIFSKIFDGVIKRREYLAAKRESPYSDFINLINNVVLNQKNEYTNEQLMKDINDVNSKLILWGSPKVVKKWNIFRKNSLSAEQNENSQQNLLLLEEVMNQMRHDLGVKSVGKGDLLSVFINDVDRILNKNSNIKKP
ncbi:hypothetical protein EF384_09450 [Aerococcus agrisoli]|uniref:Uncharacterized protein n=1 Tax=Aerococcus agrisoli TaxID=2487350 RepID=A0A3N4G2F0_9LACT|nr:hypothetical protein [Aerococcus agrisoli]RPA55527.1 hypothetical protein EF384_09450 [Aerococcus agrisoli]